ncbi:hypothetical protein DFH08DRAFT_942843 [Mycena albidolilacea]|uniref:DUF6589 domain-containing protein n=1 Tax=Mycena albidolilacea TaxID=1033008 RepID=A0AAD6ZD09_9AGAR|nr:hypothetical protein DFH08DRAFT_942843 [Mycena albidolilacea]
MKRSCRTAKKVEDIRGYSKSKSRGNPNGEGLYGKSRPTLRKQAAAREREPRAAKLYGERNPHVQIDGHCRMNKILKNGGRSIRSAREDLPLPISNASLGAQPLTTSHSGNPVVRVWINQPSAKGVLSGLMHFVMNQIQNIGKNAWGGADRDAVSLETCVKKLPNRESINVCKIDFYAWLRFLDVVLRALVLQAAIVILRLPSPEALDTCNLDDKAFCKLCTHIATQFVMPSLDRLEAEGLKRLSGSTQNANAVLLMHDLMTVLEMRQSIKFGHPERMQRMLKFWTPMFYAGGRYNYANEGMELLHNLVHDWLSEVSNILCAGMFINTQGKPNGVNAALGALEKIVPAIGHIQELREQVFEDLGIDDHDHYHSKVAQHKDVRLLLRHFLSAKVFNFSADASGKHKVAG